MTLRTETYLIRDDGTIPNNDRLPLVVYRSVFGGLARSDNERRFKNLFAQHDWGGTWVDGIYPFHHYHARSHEVLGIAAGRAEVQFGGASGPILTLEAGDAVVIPAGVGHCRRSATSDLIVVGAYPRGQEDWDLKRATEAERSQALDEIPKVPLPITDPITGQSGGLLDLWR